MDWYLVRTKPRQEHSAQEHWERQGYECYVPQVPAHNAALRQDAPAPLFPRYLFIRPTEGHAPRDMLATGSTVTTSRVAGWGQQPALVHGSVIEALRYLEAAPLGAHPSNNQDSPPPGHPVPDAVSDLASLVSLADGDTRVMALMELLSMPPRTGARVERRQQRRG